MPIQYPELQCLPEGPIRDYYRENFEQLSIDTVEPPRQLAKEYIDYFVRVEQLKGFQLTYYRKCQDFSWFTNLYTVEAYKIFHDEYNEELGLGCWKLQATDLFASMAGLSRAIPNTMDTIYYDPFREALYHSILLIDCLSKNSRYNSGSTKNVEITRSKIAKLNEVMVHAVELAREPLSDDKTHKLCNSVTDMLNTIEPDELITCKRTRLKFYFVALSFTFVALVGLLITAPTAFGAAFCVLALGGNVLFLGAVAKKLTSCFDVHYEEQITFAKKISTSLEKVTTCPNPSAFYQLGGRLNRLEQKRETADSLSPAAKLNMG